MPVDFRRPPALASLVMLVCALAGLPARARPAAIPLAAPLAFEANRGQTAAEVDFLARGDGYTLFLAGGEATFVFGRPREEKGQETCTLRLRFEGTSASAPARG